MQTENDSTQSSEQDKSNTNNATAINNLKEKHVEEKVVEAHQQADADIANDPDLQIHSAEEDLDEGESARLKPE